MTPDLDILLRGADPAADAGPDDTLLARVRARVDADLVDVVPAGHRRSPWPHRVVLIAAAAALLTTVPLVVSAVGGGDDGRPGLVPPAVAADGSISCVSGYTSAVRPEEAAVRLLPDRLPDGWSYTKLFARADDPAACGPPSLTALRKDATGLVTGRVAVTGPIGARVRQGKLTTSVSDTAFGHPARRFDATVEGVEYHRWVWSDEQGQWSAEASGMPLEEARQTLGAVSITGPQVAWVGAAAPAWTLVHLREGPPYGTVPGQFQWSVELTDGTQRRTLEVVVEEPPVPLLAGAGIGERVTSLDGRPAVLSRVRTAVDSGAAQTDVQPGTVSQPVFVEVAPGTVAYSIAFGDDLPEVERMLASLRQVPADDPRLEQYGTD